MCLLVRSARGWQVECCVSVLAVARFPTLILATNSASTRTIAPSYDSNAKEETSPPLNIQRSTPPEDSPVDMSINEEVIIDEALKEKQKIVCTKLFHFSCDY
jgi:hypothetical protein